MSALSFLYLILPLPFIFVLHYLEEGITYRRWLTKKKDRITTRFPKSSGVVKRLEWLDTFAFLFAAFEESIVFLIILALFISGMQYADEALFSIVLAFGIHLLINVVKAIFFRGYVPGFSTAVSFLVPLWFILYFFCVSHYLWEIILLAIGGVVFLEVNRIFAFWLGWKTSLVIRKLHKTITKKPAA